MSVSTQRLSRAGGARDGSRPRVMQAFAPTSMTANPYLIQLVEAAGDECDVQLFSWRDAIAGRFDVLHVHWPDFLVRSTTGPKTLLKRALFILLAIRIMVGGKAVVRTLHNVKPHEPGGRIDGYLLDLCDRLTTLWIQLTSATPLPARAAGPVVTIPHGHYRDWFAEYPAPQVVPGRLLYFGLIRPYKGVEALLEVFGDVAASDASLRIVGAVSDDALRAEIDRYCAADPRISARTEFVSDAELSSEIGQAQLVVLPYRQLHNSGSLLLALSLNRPVLVPNNEVTAGLAREVGQGWVSTFDGELTAAAIAQAQRALTDRISDQPRFKGREWSAAGRAHADAYRQAWAIVRRS